MTRTQLQEMSDRDLVAYARKTLANPPRSRYTDSICEELANRLDDRYPFNPETQPETEL